MIYKKTYKKALADFQKVYGIMAPDNKSVTIAKELWKEWEKNGITPPDIDEIALDNAKHDNGFFYELISMAEKMENKSLNIHGCQFILDQYNAYALSARDGYIVLIDDRLFQLFFFLCNILVFDAMEVIESKEEKESIKRFVDELIHSNYVYRRRVDSSKTVILLEMIKRDYDLAEFSNYLAHAIKAFIIAHEIAHHILKHTQGIMLKSFSFNGKSVAVPVDKRAIADEFEADRYAYKLFDLLLNTEDDSVYYTFCKYKLYFAPLFLFDLFRHLDLMFEKATGIKVIYNDHPHPNERIQALVQEYKIDESDLMYVSLKDSLNYYLS